MNDLKDFINTPDENLASNDKSNFVPPVTDFFDSAGNTKLENNDEPELSDAIIDSDGKHKVRGKVVLGKLISGKATVNLINIFIPSFIVFTLNKFGYKVGKQSMKLTGEEKEILAPVVQDCLDYIEIDFDNPYYTLAFVATMIYGSKILDVLPELKKVKEDIEEDNSSEEKEQVFKYKENKMKEESETLVKGKWIAVREKIDATSIRKDKNKLIIDAIEFERPKDIQAVWKIYKNIFPERSEGYFRNQWYDKNYEALPETLKFGNE